ncbi:MAG TPA: alcohol dehydrogenase catalytic domain-containing protein, partial [Gaiellaceae bacterium]|nr:alcohol dehydrogenase catalytic domain-containing protein [Gaiellaceae bacterium]
MRAVVLDSDGLPELVELPAPTGPGLHVRVLACGLCGSDVEKLGRAAPGSVLGHEVAGVLENGARVTVMHRVPCGTCERCLAGHQSTCGEFRELRIAPGGFAEELRATHCVPLPDTLGEHDGVWVEPLACVLRAAESVPRGRVLVVGCGAIGRLWIQVLRRRGDEVAVLDIRDDRIAAARLLGADVDEDPVDAAVLTAHGGVDDALHRLRPGGTLLVFAAPEESVPTSLDAIYRKELRVVGSRSASLAYFRSAVELLPTLVLPEVTTLPLDRFLEGVELYRRGDA